MCMIWENEMRDHYFILAPHPFPIFFRYIRKTVCTHSLSAYPHRRALQDSLQPQTELVTKLPKQKDSQQPHTAWWLTVLEIVHNLKATCLRIQTSWKGEAANLKCTGSSQLPYCPYRRLLCGLLRNSGTQCVSHPPWDPCYIFGLRSLSVWLVLSLSKCWLPLPG